eukprot:9176206-Alexandrium_andersonii.AAC.1
MALAQALPAARILRCVLLALKPECVQTEWSLSEVSVPPGLAGVVAVLCARDVAEWDPGST